MNGKKYTNNVEDYYWSHEEILQQDEISKVFRATDFTKDKKSTDMCAVKVINKIRLMQDENAFENHKKEVQAMKLLKLDHIVSARDIIESNNNIYIVTDLCTEGTLRNLLTRNNNYLSEQHSLRIIYSVLQGLQELFNHKISHRDLKPENIFVFKDNYKIGDFKNCFFYENQQKTYFQGGTSGYQSPQIVMGEQLTSKCDIWSIGVIFYEMIFGYLPGFGENDIERIQNIQSNGVRFHYTKMVSQSARDFMSKCMQIKEDTRIGWDQVHFIGKIIYILFNVFNFFINFRVQLYKIFDHPVFDQFKIDQEMIKSKKYEQNQLIMLSEEECNKFINLQMGLKKRGLEQPQKLIALYFTSNNMAFSQFLQLYSDIINPDDDDLQNMFNFMDYFQDGKISVEEFEYRIYQTDYTQFHDSKSLHRYRCESAVKLLKDTIVQNSINLIRLFKKYGIDKDELLNWDDFKYIVKKIDKQMNEKEKKYAFLFFDKEGNGTITKQEFIEYFRIDLDQMKILEVNGKKIPKIGQQIINQVKNLVQKYQLNINDIFFKFDGDCNGYQNKEQFGTFLRMINKKIEQVEIDEMFNAFDDGNGKLSLLEFQITFS